MPSAARQETAEQQFRWTRNENSRYYICREKQFNVHSVDCIQRTLRVPGESVLLSVALRCNIRCLKKSRDFSMKRMKRCTVCAAYTLDETHCGMQTASPHPPKYSPADKYAAYRRAALAQK